MRSSDFARKLGVQTDGHKNIETMATNIPGLFAAGDCTGGMMQIAKAVCEGRRRAPKQYALSERPRHKSMVMQ